MLSTRAGHFFSVANFALRQLSTKQLPLEARRLEKKVAIITGAASGIGEAAARLFVSHGAQVIIADMNHDLGSKVAGSLAPHAHFFHCNVAEESYVRAVVDFAISQHGNLDIMYNNVGVAERLETFPTEVSIKEFQIVMDANVKGALLGVKHAARAMMGRNGGGGGSILFSSSLAATLAVARRPGYTISKHGVVGVMKWAATDLAPYGIRVNCISPGVVITPASVDMIGSDIETFAEKHVDLQLQGGGGLMPEDVANAALFLSSDEARYISGLNLVIDGAFSTSKNPFP